MDNISPAYIKVTDILSNRVNNKEKFIERFVSIATDIEAFIDSSGLKNKVSLNYLSLGTTLVDYFEDISRLKKFHRVEHINSIKIVAYLSYWILKRKPIQILDVDKSLLYVNERFVLAYILDFLSSDQHILKRTNEGLKGFAETLFYVLKYRTSDAAIIEMTILSFFAGQIYQEKNEDLSQKLAKKYVEE